jgi:gluconolactonase
MLGPRARRHGPLLPCVAWLGLATSCASPPPKKSSSEPAPTPVAPTGGGGAGGVAAGGRTGAAAGGTAGGAGIAGGAPDAGAAGRDASVGDAAAIPKDAVAVDLPRFVAPDVSGAYAGMAPTWGKPESGFEKGTPAGFDDACSTFWNAVTNELYVIGCEINNVYRWRADTTTRNGWDQVRQGCSLLPCPTGTPQVSIRGVGIAPGGALVVAERDARRIVRSPMGFTGSEVLAERWPGGDGTPAGRFNGPYHVVVRRDGSIYFTDPGTSQSTRELPFAGIYRIDPAGRLSLLVHDGWPKTDAVPYGLALSADQTVLYVSVKRTLGGDLGLYRFPVNPDGTLGPRSLFVDGVMAGGTGGICTDQGGNVYHCNSQNIGIGVRAFSSEGKLIGTIPVESATDCTFGGPDLKTMFVTAYTGHAGTFSCVGTGLEPPCNVYRVQMSIPGSPENY